MSLVVALSGGGAEALAWVAEACDMLAREWPGGGSAEQRRRAFAASQSFGLIRADGRCVAHARVQETADTGQGAACAVTSVVVRDDLRGQGTGRVLMLGMEPRMRDAGYTYAYLWTSTAADFYARCGYSVCERVNMRRPVLGGLGERAIGALEALLAQRTNDSDGSRGGAGEHESAAGADVVWMRKRLRTHVPSTLRSDADVDTQVLDGLRGLGVRAAAFWVDGAVPLQRQIGPSCGLAALRMAAQRARPELAWDDELGLLDAAVSRGFSRDGEMFDVAQLATLASDVCELRCEVQDAAHALQPDAVNVGAIVILPYDRGAGTSLPELRRGDGAHYCVVVGRARRCADADDTGPSGRLPRASDLAGVGRRKDDDDFVVAQHGMGARLLVAPLRAWLASNAQLQPSLAGRAVVVSITPTTLQPPC